MPGKLSTYHAKRNFRVTPEPKGTVAAPGEQLRFVVQKHHARKLHYDFRLELDGTLKSWAVPKGPSLDPSEKRLAVQVEDHPLDYIDFEGDIPEQQYGAGHVDVWDIGYWEPLGDPLAAYERGKLEFRLEGKKLHGRWVLVRTHLPGGSKEQWLLIKERDEAARAHAEFDVTADMPDSVLGRARKTHDANLKSSATRKTKNAALFDMLSPQLATLVNEIPREGEWEYEVKFDGYRILARVDGKDVRMLTRDGQDWTATLPAQVQAIRALDLQSAWLDGEIVVLDKEGVPSFQLLQNAFSEKSDASFIYYLFDLPFLNGADLRPAPLKERRNMLEQLLEQADNAHLRYSAALAEPPQKLLEGACRLSMEGIIGKRADSPYAGTRNADWIKLKCRQRQEFVIGGYTEPQGTRKFFGALLLGVYEEGRLRYAGRVGTGFDRALLHSMHRQMRALERKESPFARMPTGIRRGETHWIEPQLVAEVSFAEWTDDGLLRQAAFHGLRADKAASAVRREHAVGLPSQGKPHAAGAKARTGKDIKVTHPERVIDAASGATKLDLVRYYEQVAPHILPFLHDRPVYLLRCPEGVGGEHFFQKHLNRMAIPGIRTLDPSLDPGHGPLMAIEDAQALTGAAQMGMVELHVCNASANDIDHPDCMVFDLDPDPALPWPKVLEAARLTRILLDELGLRSFVKTSGGKGLHLAVPLARRHTWSEVAHFSRAIATHMARTLPQHFSAKMGEKNRIGKIFIDTLRNRRQASVVSPYSVRARPGLPVAVPVTWEELEEISGPGAWTMASLPARLAGRAADPWEGYFQTRQVLTSAMGKRIGIASK
ncbi:MAG TPA: DNA ligase D [Noviherbaspirillum sp.]|uniref:DNA ligase D n=1 Tax=Noviherbaspirillum sp. TaxID=1926288 RepID=UPI002B46FC62|nr:DNA ligase D [Noviherbaspirillum sp.]HJV87509.1 DNA ligase D [Noviherbaspirillum sp.]